MEPALFKTFKVVINKNRKEEPSEIRGDKKYIYITKCNMVSCIGSWNRKRTFVGKFDGGPKS